MTAIGDYLKQLREQSGLSQVDLADLSGVSQSAISGIESGKRAKPQWETIKKLADALHALDSTDDQADEEDIIGPLLPPPRLAIEEPREIEISSYKNAIDEIIGDLDEEERRAVWLFASGVLAAGVPRIIGRSSGADSGGEEGISDPG